MAVHGIEDMILLKQLIKTTGNILLVSNYSHVIEYYLFRLLKLLTLFLQNGSRPANDSATHNWSLHYFWLFFKSFVSKFHNFC